MGWGGVAQRAVDGNVDGHYNRHSVSHTRTNKNVWWEVDLELTYPIYLILIHNRRDAVQNRIDGATVYVVSEVGAKQLCGRVSYRKQVGVYPISCGGKRGNKVRVEHKYNYLTLAEVQVFASAKVTMEGYYGSGNVQILSQGKPALESSEGWGGNPSRAVDGLTDGWYNGK